MVLNHYRFFIFPYVTPYLSLMAFRFTLDVVDFG